MQLVQASNMQYRWTQCGVDAVPPELLQKLKFPEAGKLLTPEQAQVFGEQGLGDPAMAVESGVLVRDDKALYGPEIAAKDLSVSRQCLDSTQDTSGRQDPIDMTGDTSLDQSVDVTQHSQADDVDGRNSSCYTVPNTDEAGSQISKPSLRENEVVVMQQSHADHVDGRSKAGSQISSTSLRENEVSVNHEVKMTIYAMDGIEDGAQELKKYMEANGIGDYDIDPEAPPTVSFITYTGEDMDLAEMDERFPEGPPDTLFPATMKISFSTVKELPSSMPLMRKKKRKRTMPVGAGYGVNLSEEQHKKMSHAFHQIDTDHNGEISVQEFRTVMAALEVKMTDQQCDIVFKSFDLNKDMKLQYDEYIQLIKEAMRKRGV
jgi:hypothetical protein